MKKSHRPQTKVIKTQPNMNSPDWIIWAAWADRITFEEIKEKTGKSENQVIKIMRNTLKPSSFKLWRKRVHSKSIKHRKKFEYSRKLLRKKVILHNMITTKFTMISKKNYLLEILKKHQKILLHPQIMFLLKMKMLKQLGLLPLKTFH